MGGGSMAEGNALKGVLLVMAAVLFFALADAVGKALVALYAAPLILAARYTVNLGLLAAVLGPSQGATLWKTQRTGLVLLRGLCLAAASLSMMMALRLMPLGETVAIIYLAPFLVMFLSGPLLEEHATRAGWMGAAVGFAGMLLIVRPGSGLDLLGVALAVLNAVLSTGYHLLTRVLAKTETTNALLFHTALVGTLVFCGLALWSLDGPLPQGWDVALVVALGALATAGHFLFTAAYREAPASLLAPVNYLHLVWAALLGWLVFGHVPNGISLLGIAMIAGAGMAVALQSQRAKRALG